MDITPDISEAQRFLDFLLGSRAQTCFQVFPNSEGCTRAPRHSHQGLSGAAAGLTRANQAGSGVYFVVNETDGKGREIKNIVRVRALFVDLDGSPLGPVIKSPMPPHVVIQTRPNRYQCFWRADPKFPLNKFDPVLRALIKKFNADANCTGLNRVMRLPGFYNMKQDPFLVKVINPFSSEAMDVQ